MTQTTSKQAATKGSAGTKHGTTQPGQGAPAQVPGQVKGMKQGVVESDARDKSRRVVVKFAAPHAKYGKFVRKQTVLHVHDEANESKKGDLVEVMPCRPISKTKAYRLVRVMERRAGE